MTKMQLVEAILERETDKVGRVTDPEWLEGGSILRGTYEYRGDAGVVYRPFFLAQYAYEICVYWRTSQ
jgi:hypothetical protein